MFWFLFRFLFICWLRILRTHRVTSNLWKKMRNFVSNIAQSYSTLMYLQWDVATRTVVSDLVHTLFIEISLSTWIDLISADSLLRLLISNIVSTIQKRYDQSVMKYFLIGRLLQSRNLILSKSPKGQCFIPESSVSIYKREWLLCIPYQVRLSL